MASRSTEASGDGSPRIQSVSRALAILTVIALSPTGVTVKELSETLKISRPTLYHLLRTLMHDAFVSRGPDRRYRLGMRVGTLAEAFSRQLAPDDELLGLMRRLADETGESAYVVARRGLEIVLLAATQGTHYVSAKLPPLGLLPDAHARASGKVALAYAPPDTQNQYIQTHILERLTERTTVDADALMQEFAKVREQGYALNLEELYPGLCALAVPFDTGTSPFVLALSAPRDRFTEHFDMYLGAVLDIAREGSTKARDVRGSQTRTAKQSSDDRA
jgi:IclR family transcriptional regulator, acetate operon repressor